MKRAPSGPAHQGREVHLSLYEALVAETVRHVQASSARDAADDAAAGEVHAKLEALGFHVGQRLAER